VPIKKQNLRLRWPWSKKNLEKIVILHNEKPACKPLSPSKLPVKEEHIYPREINEEEYTELAHEVIDSLEIIPAMVYIRRIICYKNLHYNTTLFRKNII